MSRIRIWWRDFPLAPNASCFFFFPFLSNALLAMLFALQRCFWHSMRHAFERTKKTTYFFRFLFALLISDLISMTMASPTACIVSALPFLGSPISSFDQSFTDSTLQTLSSSSSRTSSAGWDWILSKTSNAPILGSSSCGLLRNWKRPGYALSMIEHTASYRGV